MKGRRSLLQRLDRQRPRVAVFRALQLGDMLCAVPALRALRAAMPEAEITLIGLPWAKEFVRRFSRYVDRLLEFRGYPGLPESDCRAEDAAAFLQSAQAARFDLAIQLHGSGTITNPLVMLLGARHQAGFYVPGQYCPDPDSFFPYPAGEPEVRRNLRLLERLGIPLRGEELEFPIDERDRRELGQIAGTAEIQETEYICLHPGARAATRRWMPSRFAAVADALAAEGYRIVLTGSSDEAALANEVAGRMNADCWNLAGKTSLGALAALIEGSRVLISNDTGVSHIAAALGTPSVVVALGSDLARWAPADERRHRVLAHPVDCRPCSHTVCPIDFPCAEGIGVDDVVEAACELLQRLGAKEETCRSVLQ